MDGNSDSSSDEEYYRELEKIKELQKQKPPTKPAFSLKLGGLGFSTLIKANGKT
jgi:hypothetical protein